MMSISIAILIGNVLTITMIVTSSTTTSSAEL
jgi:hypothetical protein